MLNVCRIKLKVYRQWLSCLLFLFTGSMAYAQVPVLKEVTPNHGYSGQKISIKGMNFDASSKVFFGGGQGIVISQSSQLLEVEVPPTATYSKISVTNGNGLTGYSPLPFLLSYGGETGIDASNFGPQVDIDAEDGLYDITIADLDGDGLNEVIAANSKSQNATILHNASTTGNLSFTRRSLAIGGVTLNVASGDLNGDGKPEVIFSEGDNRSRIFILENQSTGPGDISFTIQQIAVAGNSTKRIKINDLDLDGKPELIITDQAGNKVSILRNTAAAGNLTFDSEIIHLVLDGTASTEGTDGLVINDMNADGKADIVVSQFLTPGNGIFIAENRSTPGNIQFNSFHNKAFPGVLVNLKIADLNNDKLPDLAGTRLLNSDVVILMNESEAGGPITLANPVSKSTSARPWGLDFGDLDGDGAPDLLVGILGSSLSVDVLHNSGSLSFQNISVPVTFINRNLKSGDMDGDGKPDIVFTSVDDDNNGIPASKISILRNISCVTPFIATESPLTICSGNTVQLSTQPVRDAIYEWRRGTTLVQTGADHRFNANQAGDYTVTLIHEGGSCSNTSEAITIEITTSGTGGVGSPVITTNSPVCTNGTLTLNSSDVNADRYVWRGPDDFTASGRSATLNNFQFSNSGKYYLDVYSGDCIVETQTVIIEAINAPDFDVSTSTTGPVCEGEAVILTISPDDPDYSYQWYRGSEAISGASSHIFTATTPGTYYAEVTDMVNATCPAIQTREVRVRFVSPPQAKFSVLTTACIGQSIAFINQSTSHAEADAKYLWEFDDGTQSTSLNPSHTYQEAGDYAIKLTVSYEGVTCRDEITKTITVQSGLDIALISERETLCSGEEIQLGLTQSYSRYNWNTGETTSTISVTEGGEYSVTVSDANGCEGSASLSIQAFPRPEVSIDADKLSVAPGEAVQLQASGLITYQWSPNEFLNDPTLPDPLAIIAENTRFTVSGTDENGCTGNAAIEIFVQKDRIANIIEPKNFFSPNDGDNINSVWIVEKIEQFPQCGVTIMDQTGNKLMEAKPYLNNWDGTVQGKLLPSGVYYYVIRCDGEEIVKSGSITLLR